ncbi:hypothetical protein L1O03_09475 [Corynebacterium uropygiale]|uniref:Uncharacterized protein n=1 Tax=Corynebacterium uropygiale TaxID=1775911 RepID=A0A9X1U1C1_9CORY|nr:hypothetical protein [Corynebacterium uropygiale]MCF4007398.1 hypothetical protein [Corynebacterium uropygiale]
MDLDALLAPVIEFFSHGIGAQIAQIFWQVFSFLYPANAEAAGPVVIPA